MADLADMADHQQSLDLKIAMARAKRQRLKPVGYCYNCNEPLTGTRCFCDVDCRDDYEKRERLARR